MLKLYSYHRCPFAIRARITLFEKGLDFEIQEEDLKNKSEELRRLHPEARVPLLVHNGFVVFDSAVITEYVDEAFEGAKLMPESAHARAAVRMWTVWCNNVFKPEVDRIKYGPGKLTSEELSKAHESMKAHLARIDSVVSKTGWLVEARFSLADIHVFPFYRQLEKLTPAFELLQNYAHAYQWFLSIESRESFKRAMAR